MNTDHQETRPGQKNWVVIGSAIALAGMLGLIYSLGSSVPGENPQPANGQTDRTHGLVIPVRWEDIGKRMTETGIINGPAFENIHVRRGDWNEEMHNLLYVAQNGPLVMTEENAGVLLNLLWAFGLGNMNTVLTSGPMADPRYGDTARFASTGGWTLAEGDVMSHYSAHPWVALTKEQEGSVERIASNIYRPCCNNSTAFPDCNHGMAMLGLVELLVKEDIPEEEIYRIALEVNRYWFPDAYATIDAYLAQAGISTQDITPKDILGPTYSSADGIRNILAVIQPPPSQNGGGCGV